jgi:hypothetical protein
MAWCALVRTWDSKRKTYQTLNLRIEDAQEPGCMVRLYDGNTVVAEASADNPQLAMAKALELAREHLKDTSITEESLAWVQLP